MFDVASTDFFFRQIVHLTYVSKACVYQLCSKFAFFTYSNSHSGRYGLPQGFERIFKQSTHMGISIMLKSQCQFCQYRADFTAILRAFFPFNFGPPMGQSGLISQSLMD